METGPRCSFKNRKTFPLIQENKIYFSVLPEKHPDDFIQKHGKDNSQSFKRQRNNTNISM